MATRQQQQQRSSDGGGGTGAPSRSSEDRNDVRHPEAAPNAKPIISSLEASNRPRRNKPLDTKLRQQKLPAWQPILTAATVIPTVFGVGIVFLPIGVALFLASQGVKESITDYTSCNAPSRDNCTIVIKLDSDFKGDVYFYYALDNYYQNHRRYMKSRSDSQLLGDLQNVGDCEPYAYMNTSSGQKVIAPCGAVANSMFNDTFTLYSGSNGSVVPWTYKGVVWPVDRDRRYKNPPGADLKQAFANTVQPPNWHIPVYELDTSNPDNNGFLNTDFIIWMRTAALPDFRKLYRILDRDKDQRLYKNGLAAGTYNLVVKSNYPVTVFGGRKYFIISTTSWAGGKNAFLGIAYIVVGSICILLGAVFLLVHLKFGTPTPWYTFQGTRKSSACKTTSRASNRSTMEFYVKSDETGSGPHVPR